MPVVMYAQSDMETAAASLLSPKTTGPTEEAVNWFWTYTDKKVPGTAAQQLSAQTGKTFEILSEIIH